MKYFTGNRCFILFFSSSQQLQDNKVFLSMLNHVLSVDGFYFSTTYDLTHTLQRLANTSPEFQEMSLLERVRVQSRLVPVLGVVSQKCFLQSALNGLKNLKISESVPLIFILNTSNCNKEELGRKSESKSFGKQVIRTSLVWSMNSMYYLCLRQHNHTDSCNSSLKFPCASRVLDP